ncbi:hypothetical protein ACLBXM_01760 [Xanthobacteraceae bacterium A53D]
MIIFARTRAAHGLAARLKGRLEGEVCEAVLDHAAGRLAAAAGQRLGHGPQIAVEPGRRLVGSGAPADVMRETGTLDVPPAPWLLPALAGLKRGEVS